MSTPLQQAMRPPAVVYHCYFCGHLFRGYGNNPAPVRSESLRCCDNCNATVVIPARLARLDPGWRPSIITVGTAHHAQNVQPDATGPSTESEA